MPSNHCCNRVLEDVDVVTVPPSLRADGSSAASADNAAEGVSTSIDILKRENG